MAARTELLNVEAARVEEGEREWPATSLAWYAIVVLMVAYTLSYVDRTLLSLLVRPVKADLGLSDTEFSLLQGFAFACLYTLLGIPFGSLADRIRRRNLIAAGVGVWSLMTALCGFATNFAALFSARVGVGIGEASLGPAAYSMIADYFPASRRGRALAAYSTGVYVGAGLAILVGGLVVAAVSSRPELTLPLIGSVHAWQAAFLLVGAPGFLVALWILSVREPPRRVESGSLSVRPSSWRQVAAFMNARRGFFFCHFAGVSLLTLLFNGVSAWIPAYLQRHFGFSTREIAWTFGPIVLVAGMLGVVAGGWLADVLRGRGRIDAELRVVLISALLVWPFGATATLQGDATLSLILLACLIFFSSFAFGAAIAALQLVTPGPQRGRVSAVYLLIVNLSGIGLGGTATALVTDFVFHDEQRVGTAIAWVAGLSAPLAALLIQRGRAYYIEALTSQMRIAAGAPRL